MEMEMEMGRKREGKKKKKKGQGNNVGRMSFLTAARVPVHVERGKLTLPNAAAYTAATDWHTPLGHLAHRYCNQQT